MEPLNTVPLRARLPSVPSSGTFAACRRTIGQQSRRTVGAADLGEGWQGLAPSTRRVAGCDEIAWKLPDGTVSPRRRQTRMRDRLQQRSPPAVPAGAVRAPGCCPSRSTSRSRRWVRSARLTLTCGIRKGRSGMHKPPIVAIAECSVIIASVVAIGSSAAAQAVNLQEGERFFRAQCASCHSSADTTASDFPRPRNRTDLADVIRNGVEGTQMRGVPDEVSDQTVEQVAAYTEWLTGKSENCDSPTDESGRLLCPAIGQEVLPREELEAWETLPPRAFLLSRGQPTSITAKEPYVVRDVRVVSVWPFGEMYYLKVENADNPEDPCRERDCWVLQGTTNFDSSLNFTPR